MAAPTKFNIPYGLNVASADPTDTRMIVQDWTDRSTLDPATFAELPLDLRYEGMIIFVAGPAANRGLYYLSNPSGADETDRWTPVGSSQQGSAIDILDDLTDVIIGDQPIGTTGDQGINLQAGHTLVWHTDPAAQEGGYFVNELLRASNVFFDNASMGIGGIDVAIDVQGAIAAIDTYLQGLSSGFRFLGTHSAAPGILPAAPPPSIGGTFQNGDYYIISASGTLPIKGDPTFPVTVGDQLIYNDLVQGNWEIVQRPGITRLGQLDDVDFITNPPGFSGGEVLTRNIVNGQPIWEARLPATSTWLAEELKAGSVVVSGGGSQSNTLTLGSTSSGNFRLDGFVVNSNNFRIDAAGSGQSALLRHLTGGVVEMRSLDASQAAFVRTSSDELVEIGLSGASAGLATSGVRFVYGTNGYTLPKNTPAQGDTLIALDDAGSLGWSQSVSASSDWIGERMTLGNVVMPAASGILVSFGTANQKLGSFDVIGSSRAKLNAPVIRLDGDVTIGSVNGVPLYTFPVTPPAEGNVLKFDNGQLIWGAPAEDTSLEKDLKTRSVYITGDGVYDLYLGTSVSRLRDFKVQATSIELLSVNTPPVIAAPGGPLYTLPGIMPAYSIDQRYVPVSGAAQGDHTTLTWAPYVEQLDDLIDVNLDEATLDSRSFLAYVVTSPSTQDGEWRNVNLTAGDVGLTPVGSFPTGDDNVQVAIEELLNRVNSISSGIQYLGKHTVPSGTPDATNTNLPPDAQTVGDFYVIDNAGQIFYEGAVTNVQEGNQLIWNGTGYDLVQTTVNVNPTEFLPDLSDVLDSTTQANTTPRSVLIFEQDADGQGNDLWTASQVDASELTFTPDQQWNNLSGQPIPDIDDGKIALDELYKLIQEIIANSGTFPEVTALPKVNLIVSGTPTLVEIGSTISGTLQVNFNRGIVTQGDKSTEIPLVGPEDPGTRVYTGPGTIDQSTGDITGAQLLTEGNYQWQVDFTYTSGVVPVPPADENTPGVLLSYFGNIARAVNVPSIDKLRVGDTVTDTSSPPIKARMRAYFATAPDATSLNPTSGDQIKQLAQSALLQNTNAKGSFTFTIPAGHKRIIIAVPNKGQTISIRDTDTGAENKGLTTDTVLNGASGITDASGVTRHDYLLMVQDLPGFGYNGDVEYEVVLS